MFCFISIIFPIVLCCISGKIVRFSSSVAGIVVFLRRIGLFLVVEFLAVAAQIALPRVLLVQAGCAFAGRAVQQMAHLAQVLLFELVHVRLPVEGVVGALDVLFEAGQGHFRFELFGRRVTERLVDVEIRLLSSTS